MSLLAEAFVELRLKGANTVFAGIGRVREAMARLAEGAKRMSEVFGRALKGLADSVGAGFINRWNQFMSLMKNAQAFTSQLVSTFTAAGMRAGSALVAGLASKISGASAAISQKLRDAFAHFTLGKLDIGFARLLFGLNDLPGIARESLAKVKAALASLPASIAQRTGMADVWNRLSASATNAWQRINGTATGVLASIQSRVRSFSDAVQNWLTAPFRAFTTFMQSRMPATWAQMNIGLQIVRARATQAAAGLRTAFGSFTSWVGSAIPAAFQQAFSRITQAAQAVGQGIARFITGSLNVATTSARALGAAVAAAWGNAVPVIGWAFNAMRSGFGMVTGLAGRLGSALMTPFTMLKRFFMSWQGMLASMGVGLGAAGIGKYIAEVTADAETARVAFSTMLGGGIEGMERAKALLSDIQKLTDKTPLELPETRAAGRTLLAMGIAGNQVVDSLRMIGDVASGVKVPIEHLASIYGKINLLNKAQGEELRQFAENGIPVVDELAKKYGVTTQAIYKMGEEGKIAFKDVQEVFIRLTSEGGRFHGMMDKLGQTLTGRMSTLRDTMRSIAVQIGESVAPALKRALEWGVNFAETLKSKLAPLKAMLANFADGMVAKLPQITKVFENVWPVVLQGARATFAVMRSISEIAGAIRDKVLGWAGGTDAVRGGISRIIQAVQFLAENWRAAWDVAIAYGRNFWQNTASMGQTVFRQLGDNISKLFANLMPAVQSFIAGIKSLLLATAYSVRDAFMGTNLYGDIIDQENQNAAKSFEMAMKQAARNAFRDMPGFDLGKFKPSAELEAALKKMQALRKLFDFKESTRPFTERLTEMWAKFKEAREGMAAKAAEVAAQGQTVGLNGKDKPAFAVHSLTDMWKTIQQGIKGDAAKQALNVANQQLDVAKKQLAIAQRQEQDRKNMMLTDNWARVAPSTFS